ncbi:MAG: 16S rRNA (uracil(1498)-N(3))-methyltransferase [Bacillota bacterium]|nr:16S rRNA (uracil(1498)-N(3))-methyltransferase [Bacillota bacterium]
MNRICRQRSDRVDRSSGLLIFRDKENINHIQVLRIRDGEEIEVIDPIDHALYRCRCPKAPSRGMKEVPFELIESRPLREERIRISLYQGIPKGSKLDTIVRQTTEIGVDAIVPVALRRSVAEAKKGDRLQRIAEEAALQSKRESIPTVGDAVTLDQAISDLRACDMVLVFDEESSEPLRPTLSRFRERMQGMERSIRIAVLIGPEGGLERSEVALLRDRVGDSVAVVSLGHRILRTETAGLSAISKILYEMEETV